MSCSAHDLESLTLPSYDSTDECMSKYQDSCPVLDQVLQYSVKRAFDVIAAGFKWRHQAISGFYQEAQARLHRSDFLALC